MDVRALGIGIAALAARLRCVYRSRPVEEMCLRNGLVRRSRRLLIGDQDGQLVLSEGDAIAVQRQKRGDVHGKRGTAPTARLDGGRCSTRILTPRVQNALVLPDNRSWLVAKPTKAS